MSRSPRWPFWVGITGALSLTCATLQQRHERAIPGAMKKLRAGFERVDYDDVVALHPSVIWNVAYQEVARLAPVAKADPKRGEIETHWGYSTDDLGNATKQRRIRYAVHISARAATAGAVKSPSENPMGMAAVTQLHRRAGLRSSTPSK